MCARCEARERNRAWYRSRGGMKWRRPLKQEVDEVAVEKAMRGERVELSVADCYEAVQRLTKLGRTAGQIADLLRVHRRTVTRYRTRPQPVIEACEPDAA